MEQLSFRVRGVFSPDNFITNLPNMSPFYYNNGSLFCENVEVERIFCETEKGEESHSLNVPGYNKTVVFNEPPTPAYVYSLRRVQRNVESYLGALHSCQLQGKIGYAIKANSNLFLFQEMKKVGVEMIIAVSGYEVVAGLKAGFTPSNIILNGNGKQEWEIKLAIERGIMMNVDSVFDALRIAEVHEKLDSENEVNVLLRIRPNKPTDLHLKLTVHEYVNTAENSKFGFSSSELDDVLQALSSRERIKVVGVHCHFGSGIKNPKIYEWLGGTITEMRNELQTKGISMKVANVGGGIAINYYEKPKGFTQFLNGLAPEIRASYEDLRVITDEQKDNLQEIPSVSSFVSALPNTIPKDVEVIFEPGRSLIGNAGILVSTVLGTKTSSDRRIMVVDGSMNEVIRPCLYGAHHEICPTKIHPHKKWKAYDIVGPICESSDFLGKRVPMQNGSNYVAVVDCGAYCSSMASTYNLKPKAAEILVSGNEWKCIRSRNTFQEIMM